MVHEVKRLSDIDEDRLTTAVWTPWFRRNEPIWSCVSTSSYWELVPSIPNKQVTTIKHYQNLLKNQLLVAALRSA